MDISLSLAVPVTATPSTSLRASVRSRNERWRSSSPVTMVMEAGASLSCCSKPEAVTTTSPSVAASADVCCAKAPGLACKASSAVAAAVARKERAVGLKRVDMAEPPDSGQDWQ
ncbi:hypothetical protein D3C86_1803280 [compost metagenome]